MQSCQLSNKGHDLLLAFYAFDTAVLRKNSFGDFDNAARLLEKPPNTSTNIVKAIVLPVACTEEHSLIPDLTRDLLRRREHNAIRRNGAYLRSHGGGAESLLVVDRGYGAGGAARHDPFPAPPAGSCANPLSGNNLRSIGKDARSTPRPDLPPPRHTDVVALRQALNAASTQCPCEAQA